MTALGLTAEQLAERKLHLHAGDASARISAILAAAAELRPFCIEWIGGLDRRGYGKRWNPAKGRMDNAHRMAWEERYQQSAASSVRIDHLCRNPRCINPDHLEAVSQSENNLRGLGAMPRQFCPSGHAKTAENTNTSGGKRTCRICERGRKRRYKAKIRGVSQ